MHDQNPTGVAAGGIASRQTNTLQAQGFLHAQLEQLGCVQDNLIVVRNKLSELGFYPHPTAPAPDSKGPEQENNARTLLVGRIANLTDLAKQVQQQVEQLG